MRFLFLQIIFLTAFCSAWAKPNETNRSTQQGEVDLLCVYEGKLANLDSHFGIFESIEGDAAVAAGPQCREMEKYAGILSGTAYGLDVASFVMACTGVGSPGTVFVAGTSLAIKGVAIFVRSLPCEDQPVTIQEQVVRESVCRALEDNGVACDPKSLQNIRN